jgi:uncharacterized protein YndB with AHSA1/START domain
MEVSTNTLEFILERIIPAPLIEVFDGWLDPKIPGNPWNAAEKFILDPKVDGLFFWTLSGNSHYGRFTEIERPARIQHTWVSPSTLGRESTVTLTFKKHGEDTRMTLVHSGLPDNDGGRGHQKGWNYFLDIFSGQLGNISRNEQ